MALLQMAMELYLKTGNERTLQAMLKLLCANNFELSEEGIEIEEIARALVSKIILSNLKKRPMKLTPKIKTKAKEWSFMTCEQVWRRLFKLTDGKLPRKRKFIPLLNPFFFIWWGERVYQAECKLGIKPPDQEIFIFHKRESKE